MITKKFYLTIEHRDTIVNALLKERECHGRRLDTANLPGAKVLSRLEIDASEQKIQEIEMLTELLNVEDNER